MPEKGTFLKRVGSFEGWYWICHDCQPAGVRTAESQAQAHKPSFLEREVSRVLAKSGYAFKPQFKFNDASKFRYDFAVPKLALIIEADGRRWHPENNWKDKVKTREAEESGWKVARIVFGPDIEGRVQAALDLRNAEIYG